MSIFGLLSVGAQSILTHQKSIDAVNENIANQDNEEYARQRVNLQDVVPAGVQIKNLQRIFDNHLFNRFLKLNQETSGDKTYTDVLHEVETMFNDIHGSGFFNNINKFFNAFSDVAVNPDDPAARDAVISAARQLIANIRDTYNNMQKIKEETSLSIKDSIHKINNILKNIAQLNKNIKSFRYDDTRLNNYLNQRDALLKELSSYIDIKVTYRDDNTADVYTVKGYGLVLYDQYKSISYEYTQEGAKVKVDNVDLTNLFKNGKVGGALRAINKINQKITDLNDFTALFASSVNKLHRHGYDLNGNTGRDFFKISPDSSLDYINASNIDLNINDYKEIAVAADSRYLNSDNSIAKSIFALKDFNEITTKTTNNSVSSTTTFGGGSFDIVLDNKKIATVNYTSTDTISDIVNKINNSQSLVVAKLYENPPSSGNYYIQFFAKDIKLSPSIKIENDTGNFVSTVGGIDNYKSLYNPEEKALLTSSSGLTFGSTTPKYKISNVDNLTLLGNKSFQELYTKRFTSELGIEISDAKERLDSNKKLLEAVKSKIEEKSGVNVDEELVNLMKYQRAYQSAAKLITVTDELIQTILGLVK